MPKKSTAESLRAFYKLGQYVRNVDARGVDPATGRRTSGSLARLCERTRCSRNELTKARKFARLYSPARLKELLALGKTYGQPLTKTHICRLVVVQKSALRDKLAKDCAEQRWTVLRLEHEIQRIQPKREYGGRRLNPPKSVEDALMETLRIANRWIRWTDVLTRPKDECRTTKGLLNKMPTGMGRRQIAITADMENLQRQILRLLKRQAKVQGTTSGRSRSR